MNKPTIRPESAQLLDAIAESGKAPKEFVYAYALGMAWSLLTEEQKSRLVEVAKM